MRWMLFLLLIPTASGCSWVGPEGWARLDMTDWSYETHQVQGMMADGSCRLETPFDLDDVMVWIDDGYDRRQVGIDDGQVQVVAAPGTVLDVAAVGDEVYASIRLQAANVAPGMLRLMHWSGTWEVASNQPPPGWTGDIDGPHAASRADDVLTVYDFIQGRSVATADAGDLDDSRFLGFDEGRFWFWEEGTFIGRGVGGQLRVQTDHEEVFGWATDGNRLVWQGYPEAEDGPVLRMADGKGTHILARWPNDTHVGDVVLLRDDHLVVVTFGINEWRDGWVEPIQAEATPTGTEPAPAIEEAPMPLWIVLGALVASKTVSRRRL